MKASRRADHAGLEGEVQAALEWLKAHGTQATRDGMARYAIPADKPATIETS
jgi:hypothetical protein